MLLLPSPLELHPKAELALDRIFGSPLTFKVSGPKPELQVGKPVCLCLSLPGVWAPVCFLELKREEHYQKTSRRLILSKRSKTVNRCPNFPQNTLGADVERMKFLHYNSILPL